MNPKCFFISLCLAGMAMPAGAAPRWIKMPLLTPAQKVAGIAPGGEGAQWPRGPVAVSPADPNFLLLPIDVGGLYRSLDGGKHWEVTMVGWNARGANAFAIDPRIARRVIGIGGNAMNWDKAWGPSPNGLYLSTNKAASWKQMLAFTDGFANALAWDPASFDGAKGYCKRAYCLTGTNGLLRSDDGGMTWVRLAAAPEVRATEADWTQGGGIGPSLAVGGRGGAVYVGGRQGLFRSDDHGATWSKVVTTSVFSLCVGPGGLYVSGPDGISLSRDGGRKWSAIPCHGLDTLDGKPIRNVTVSSVNHKRMLCWVAGNGFNWPRYVSGDAGVNWQPAKTERDAAPLPMNARQAYATWSPRDENVAWSLGGDWITLSADGGKTFRWSNNGYSGVMAGGLFNLSAREPNTVFIGFQDYNGALTADGGATWNYRDVSGKGWGGHEYGAFALSREVMWSGDADSWGTARRLRLSRDGGTTWGYVNGLDGKPLEYGGADVSCGDPADSRVGFASNLRTADSGVTWRAMAGCDGVFTHGPLTNALYGKHGNSIVRSTDHGVIWQKVIDMPGSISDIAVDDRTGIVYAASEDRLKAWRGGAWTTLNTPSDQYGNIRVTTIATDPREQAVIYVGGPRNIYSSAATICRSTDAGKTWTNLTVTAPLGRGESGGPHEVSAVRVHPVTREAWVAGQCFGLWRIAPPGPSEIGRQAAEASSPRAALPPATP